MPFLYPLSVLCGIRRDIHLSILYPFHTFPCFVIYMYQDYDLLRSAPNTEKKMLFVMNLEFVCVGRLRCYATVTFAISTRTIK